MKSITILADDVVAAFDYTYRRPFWIDKRTLLLSRIGHRLEVEIDGFDFEEVGTKGGKRVALTLVNRKASVVVTRPDLRSGRPPDDELPPALEKGQGAQQEVEVSGRVLLKDLGGDRYRVDLGELRCRLTENLPRALLRLWPCPQDQKGPWSYSFLPEGLALTGPVRVAQAHALTLLLPRAEAGDVSWDPGATQLHLWQHRKIQNDEKLHLAYAGPEGGWGKSAWLIRRWQLVTQKNSLDFLDQAFSEFARDGVLSLGQPLERSVEGEVLPHCAEVVEFREIDFRHPERNFREMVVSSSTRVPAVSFQWPRERGTTTFAAGLARAGFRPAKGEEHPLERGYFRLVSREDHPALDQAVRTSWKPGGDPSTDLKPFPLHYAGIAGEGAPNAPALDDTLVPTHLCIQGGSLAVAEALRTQDETKPEEAVTWEKRPAVRLMKRVTAGSEIARGGFPVFGKDVPDELVCWACRADGKKGLPTAVRLSLSAGMIELHLWDSVVTWRTPAWWLRPIDDPSAATGSGLQRFRASLESELEDVGGDAAAGKARLERGLAEVLCATLWVGDGKGSLSTWEVSRVDGVSRFRIQKRLADKVSAWVDIPKACVLSTRLGAAQQGGSLLLDPGRSLQRVDAPQDDLLLEMRPAHLPSLHAPLIASPEAPARTGKVAANECFLPLVPGLTYQPERREFTYRHGLPILARAWLRMQADGTLGETESRASLVSVRPRDDVAIPPFATQAGAAKDLVLTGWLPAGGVKIPELHVDWGFASGGLALKVPVRGGDPHTVRINTAGNGFGMDVQVGVETKAAEPYWLERGSQKPLLNFGQHLLTIDGSLPSVDAAGMAGRFEDGSRVARSHEGVQTRRISHTFSAWVAAGAAGRRSMLSLSLLDVPDRGVWPLGAWELSAVDRPDDATGSPSDAQDDQRDKLEERGTARAGPFELLPVSLAADAQDGYAMRVRVSSPGLPRDVAWRSCGKEATLVWRKSGAAWAIVTSDQVENRFDWRYALEPGQPGPRRLEGSVHLQSGQFWCRVERATLATVMGELVFDVEPTPLVFDSVEAGGAASCVLQSKQDPGTGFDCAATITSAAKGAWSVSFQQAPRWDIPGDVLVTLDAEQVVVDRLRLHPAAVPIPAFATKLSQHTESSWGAAWSSSEADGQAAALARALFVFSTTNGGVTPRLDIGVRATTPLEPAKVLGPCDADSWVRADIGFAVSGARSRRVFHGACITGCAKVVSDFTFRMAAGKDRKGGEEVFTQTAAIWFDRAPLDANGGLAKDALLGVVAYEFESKASGRKASFQLAQRLALWREKEVLKGLHAMTLAVVTPDAAPAATIYPQIRIDGQPAIGLANRIPSRDDFLPSVVLRVPLQTGGSKVELDVPREAPAAERLRWHPVLVAPEPRGGERRDDPWYWRGSLAERLDPAAIAELLELRGPVPSLEVRAADEKKWPGWGGVLTEARPLHAGMLGADHGAVRMPFVVGAPSSPVAAGGSAPKHQLLDLLAPGEHQIFQPVASALVQLEQPASSSTQASPPVEVVRWARSEARRQMLRGVSVVVPKGTASAAHLLARTFQAASIDDAERADALADGDATPPRSLLMDRPRERRPTQWTAPMVVDDQPDAVLEVVASQPHVDGVEVGRRSRVAVASLWRSELAADAPPALAFAARRRIDFGRVKPKLVVDNGSKDSAQRANAADELPDVDGAMWPSISVKGQPLSRELRLPPLMDTMYWVPRGGDRITTNFAATDGQTEAPPVRFALREARPNNGAGLAGQTLSLAPSLEGVVGGVRWVLHRVLKQVPAGAPDKSPLADGNRVSVVTPRGSVHVALVQGVVSTAKIALEYKVKKVEPTATPTSFAGPQAKAVARKYQMTEPLLMGLFRGEAPAAKGEVWIAVARSGSKIVSTGRVLRAVGATWDPKDFDAVLLLAVPDRSALPGTGDAGQKASYSSAAGRILRQAVDTVRITDETILPWLLGIESSLVLLDVNGNTCSATRVASLVWQEGEVAHPPEQILLVAEDRVLGFGELSTKSTLKVSTSGDAFVLERVALALHSPSGDDVPVPKLWGFESSGACSSVL
jgi:hypothetical protein